MRAHISTGTSRALSLTRWPPLRAQRAPDDGSWRELCDGTSGSWARAASGPLRALSVSAVRERSRGFLEFAADRASGLVDSWALPVSNEPRLSSERAASAPGLAGTGSSSQTCVASQESKGL